MSRLGSFTCLLLIALATLDESSSAGEELSSEDATGIDDEEANKEDAVKEEATEVIELRMPNITTEDHDQYLVTPIRVDYEDAYIVGYNPKASAEAVHHILIYGCSAPHRADQTYWVVGDMGGICDWQGNISTILWAWALDAPDFTMPENVAFHIGSNADINFLLLQVHYKYKIDSGESSGVDVVIGKQAPLHLAGIYLFATGNTKIPGHMAVNADTTCSYNEEEDMTPFAFRTHTHKLGAVVSAWREREGDWTLLGSGDPRKPQMFYLMEGSTHVIKTGDLLHARCLFINDKDTEVDIGATGQDEMCNFYMMYYQTADKFKLEEGCFREQEFMVPDYAKVDFIVNTRPIKLQYAEVKELTYEVDTSWTTPPDIKQMGGMACNANHTQLVVFHRADNDWSKEQWFDDNDEVLFPERFIHENTILFLDPETGKKLRSLGGGHFIMPHGVFVDHHGNVWVTDVALHQVMKFEVAGTEPSLVLGTKLQPGSDHAHFCKPTSVVVDVEDNVYVSDGYCNSRVVKFSKFGTFVAEFGEHSAEKGVAGGMGLVHDLAINHVDRVIYVADRENGQVHVMSYGGDFLSVYSVPGAAYALEYIPEMKSVAVVNVTEEGKQSSLMITNPAQGGNITTTYPINSSRPHALAHVRHVGVYVGELTAPFTIWKLRETALGTDRADDSLLHVLTTNIPLSFVVVILVLALIPIAYMSVLLVLRCRNQRQRGAAAFDKTGFQKLLRDYDSSEEEEDLVFKNSKVYK